MSPTHGSASSAKINPDARREVVRWPCHSPAVQQFRESVRVGPDLSALARVGDHRTRSLVPRIWRCEESGLYRRTSARKSPISRSSEFCPVLVSTLTALFKLSGTRTF